MDISVIPLSAPVPTAFFVLSHPIYPLRPSFSLLLLVVTQIRGYTTSRLSPLPTTVRALISIARRPQPFLPSSTRIEFLLYAVRKLERDCHSPQ